MYLLINTIEADQVKVYLRGDRKISYEAFAGDYKASEKLLFVIDKLVKKTKVDLNELKGIIVLNGIGSFTALRIAVSVANTLSFVLKIPVVDYEINDLKNIDIEHIFDSSIKKLKKMEGSHFIMPKYDGEPNIS